MYFLSVCFATGVQRKLFQTMHMFGNHVVGKPATQIFLYLLFVELFLLYDEMQFALVVVVVFGNDDYTAFTVEKVFATCSISLSSMRNPCIFICESFRPQ